MYYDITNPNVSYDWIHEALQIKKNGLIQSYSEECHNDFDTFYEKYHLIIDKMDIENLEIVAFQVTSSSNRCTDIKKYGLHNLQWVLSNNTELNKFLKKNNISFDVKKKLMYICDKVYNINYEGKADSDLISERNKNLNKIGHKIYYDFQINAFLFYEDIYEYSTVCEAPEFLYTLSSLCEATKGIDMKWKELCEPYVIKFKSTLKDFAYFTFYDNEIEYEKDRQDNWLKLRRWLILRAIESAYGELSGSEIFAYMKPDTVIVPQNIIDCIEAKVWRENVLKYFGKR